jgi:hypothetical protein
MIMCTCCMSRELYLNILVAHLFLIREDTICHTTRKGQVTKLPKTETFGIACFASDQYRDVSFITYLFVIKRLAPVPSPQLDERVISPACNKFLTACTVPALDSLATLVSGHHDI